MAVQMLYQSDLGGSPLSNIFNTFDLTEYLATQAGAARRRAAAVEDEDLPELPAPAVSAGALAPFAPFAPALPKAPPPAPPRPPLSPAPPLPPLPSSPPLPPTTAADRAEAERQRRRVEEAFHYAQELVRGTVDHREEIDAMIRGQADNWRLERMPAVDRNILRLAIFEMLYERDTPKLVVVDEAIELAKKFGSEQSGRFVNGLLDGLLKQHSFPGSLT
jgi:N utilization substance protein B